MVDVLYAFGDAVSGFLAARMELPTMGEFLAKVVFPYGLFGFFLALKMGLGLLLNNDPWRPTFESPTEIALTGVGFIAGTGSVDALMVLLGIIVVTVTYFLGRYAERLLRPEKAACSMVGCKQMQHCFTLSLDTNVPAENLRGRKFLKISFMIATFLSAVIILKEVFLV